MSIIQISPWEPTERTSGQITARRPSGPDTFSQKSGLTRRGVIYEFIRTHPGIHVRGMANELGLATGDLQYHLVWLEKNGYVKTVKTGFYRFVYPTMVFRREQELLLGVLSKETPRGILLSLLDGGDLSQGDLARTLGCSQPTICWHIDRLTKMGVLKRGTATGSAYEVAADKDEVEDLMKSYYPDQWSKWTQKRRLMVAAGVKRSRTGTFERAN